jgi:GT2 family glycosyltransferase
MIYTIVVTFNGANWIRKCLDSLLSSTIKTEVLIVDNCSTDDTLRIIEEEYPTIKIIENHANLGFGQANNLGFEVASKYDPEYFLLLNQDAWLEPDTLEKLIEAAKKNQDHYILSPLHLNANGSDLDFNFIYHLAKDGETIIREKYSFNDSRELVDVTFINAAIWLLPGDCIKQVGMFDPLFYHYGEDNDYASRVRYHGYKIGVIPQAVGFHGRAQQLFDYNQLSPGKKFLKRKIPYLITMMNINHSLVANLRLSGGLLAGELVKHAKRFNIFNIFIELLSFTNIMIFYLFEIITHREQNKLVTTEPS